MHSYGLKIKGIHWEMSFLYRSEYSISAFPYRWLLLWISSMSAEWFFMRILAHTHLTSCSPPFKQMVTYYIIVLFFAFLYLNLFCLFLYLFNNWRYFHIITESLFYLSHPFFWSLVALVLQKKILIIHSVRWSIVE